MRHIVPRLTFAIIAWCSVPTLLSAEGLPENAHDRSQEKVTSFRQLDQLAAATAAEPYRAPPDVPPALAHLEYEQYRDIQFRPERGVWWGSDSPFSLETFHRGFVQRDRVSLFTLDDDGPQEVPFRTEDFQYGTPISSLKSLKDAGHAGIKVVGRFPGGLDAQEMLTFLGSSYFRARSGETLYGTSARGLAIDIGLPKEEEFPRFKTFWVRKPEASDETLTVFALMDSSSVSGAYAFKLKPGAVETRIGVRCSLHFRSAPEKVAIAPLTGMWIWGDGLDGPALDKRPACHDCDGLLIRTGLNKWTWRAFARQDYPSVSTLHEGPVLGFGLLQRNRAFYHFDDHNAQYHKRPSVWITPKSSGRKDDVWRQGRIELLELPGAHEGVDNIGAYFVPSKPPSIDHPMRFSYDISFYPGDHADQDFIARSTHCSIDRQEELIELKVRFSGEAVRQMCHGTVAIDETLTRGKLLSKSAERTDTGDWIATLVFQPTEKAPVEIELTLLDENRVLSERFCYLCPDKQPRFMYPQVYTRKE